MYVNITPRRMRNGERIYYTFEWGKKPGQRKASGIFTFTHPSTLIEREHNKEASRLLAVKRAHLMLDWQAIGTGIIPMHRLQANFLDFYSDYVDRNKRLDYRHLPVSFTQFKAFVNSDYLSPHDVTADLCGRFRQYLLNRFNGHTPANYFARFKRMVKAATLQGYFRVDPCIDVAARAKLNAQRKDHLEAEEYLRLLNTPCDDLEVRDAFIFCCYTGLRWCDVRLFSPSQIKNEYLIVQQKTQTTHHIILHPVAKAIVDNRISKRIGTQQQRLFSLPTAEVARKVLAIWCRNAGIEKHITWSCARLSFSILLQDALIDSTTVSLLLGHRTTRQVFETYRRFRPKNQKATIAMLPNPDQPHQALASNTIKTSAEAFLASSSDFPLAEDIFQSIHSVFNWLRKRIIAFLNFIDLLL